MGAYIKQGGQIKGFWPRVKHNGVVKIPKAVYVKHNDVWYSILRNSIKILLNQPVYENFNLKQYMQDAGLWLTTRMRVELEIAEGTSIVSKTPPLFSPELIKPAFSSGSGWPSGSRISVVNRGAVISAGGRPVVYKTFRDPASGLFDADIHEVLPTFSKVKGQENWQYGYMVEGYGWYKTGREESYVAISSLAKKSDGSDFPTSGEDGGDAFEFFTNFTLDNYGVIAAGGGAGGSMPHIIMANKTDQYVNSPFAMSPSKSIVGSFLSVEPEVGGVGATSAVKVGSKENYQDVYATYSLTKINEKIPGTFVNVTASTNSINTLSGMSGTYPKFSTQFTSQQFSTVAQVTAKEFVYYGIMQSWWSNPLSARYSYNGPSGVSNTVVYPTLNNISLQPQWDIGISGADYLPIFTDWEADTFEAGRKIGTAKQILNYTKPEYYYFDFLFNGGYVKSPSENITLVGNISGVGGGYGKRGKHSLEATAYNVIIGVWLSNRATEPGDEAWPTGIQLLSELSSGDFTVGKDTAGTSDSMYSQYQGSRTVTDIDCDFGLINKLMSNTSDVATFGTAGKGGKAIKGAAAGVITNYGTIVGAIE